MLELAGFNVGLVDQWNPDNRLGNRENLEVLTLNESVLAQSGGTWKSPPQAIAPSIEQIAARDRILNEFIGGARPWMFKDPRTLLTLTFWKDAIADVQLIGIVRNPISVAESLNARDGFAVEAGLRLWRHYNELLLKAAQRYDVPILYFIDEARAFIAAAQNTLTGLFPKEVEKGILNPSAMHRFFSKELVHRNVETIQRITPRLLELGLEAEQAEGIRELWGHLLEKAINPPRLGRSLPHRSDEMARQESQSGPDDTDARQTFDEELSELDRRIAHAPSQTELYRRAIKLFESRGKADQTVAWLRGWLSTYPADPFLLFEVAKRDWEDGHKTEAVAEMEKCAVLASGWLPPLRVLAEWYTKAEDWQAATVALKKITSATSIEEDIAKSVYAQLYFDRGNGFNETDSIRQNYFPGHETVTITFNLPKNCKIRGLRVDPINQPAVIDFVGAYISDEKGSSQELGLARTSAKYTEDSSYYFHNDDPAMRLLWEPSVNFDPRSLNCCFRVLHTGRQALQACIDKLSEIGTGSVTGEGSHLGCVVEYDSKSPVPSCVKDWHFRWSANASKQPFSGYIEGQIIVDRGSIVNLALRTTSATRVYPLNLPIGRRPDGGFLTKERGALETLAVKQAVSANSVIEVGIEYDMRLFWLAKLEPSME